MKKKCIGLLFLTILSLSATFVSYGSPDFQSAGYISTARGGKNPMGGDYNSNCMFYTWGRTYEKTGQELPSILRGWHGYLQSEQLPQHPRENAIAFWGDFNYKSHSAYVESFENGILSYSEGNYHPDDNSAGKYHVGSGATDAFRNRGGMKFYGFVYLQGWAKDATENHWKYWKTDGSQATGWNLIDGWWFYFDSNGIMTTDWQRVNGKYYYLGYNGAMRTGWQQIGGKYYFFHTNGEMAVGWLELDDGYYYLGSDGVMYADRWMTEEGIRYRLGADGRMLRNVCSRIDGVEYDFDHRGAAEKKMQPETEPETQPETTSAPEPETAESKGQVTEYSYRTRTKKEETKTSEDPGLSGWECVGSQAGTGSWGSWSSWSEESRESSSDTQVETRTVSTGETVQIYLGRYYSAQKNKFSPNKLDSTYAFEGGWFEEDSVTFVGQAYAGGRSDCYTVQGYHYYFFEIGSHGGETRTVSTGSRTEYRYRQKSSKTLYQYRRFVYSGWSDWSNWSETPVYKDELTDVRTREKTI